MRKILALLSAFILTFYPLAVFAVSMEDADYEITSITLQGYSHEGGYCTYVDENGVGTSSLTLDTSKSVTFQQNWVYFTQQNNITDTQTFYNSDEVEAIAANVAEQLNITMGDSTALPINEDGLYGLVDTQSYDPLYGVTIFNGGSLVTGMYNDEKEGIYMGYIGNVEFYVQYVLRGLFQVDNDTLTSSQETSQYLTYHYTITVDPDTMYSRYTMGNYYVEGFKFGTRSTANRKYSQFDMEVYLSDEPVITSDIYNNPETPYNVANGGTPVYSTSLLEGEHDFTVEVKCGYNIDYENMTYVEIENAPTTTTTTTSLPLAAAAATAVGGTALGIAGAMADNSTEESYRNRKIQRTVSTTKMSEAVEDANISVSNLSEKLVNEKGGHVTYPISNDDTTGLKWHYISKVALGTEVATSHCTGSNVVISLTGEEMSENDTTVSVVVIGWSIGADGTLHKGITGFEVKVNKPGLFAKYLEDGTLEVTWKKSGKVKGILDTITLSESDYTIEEGKIIANADKTVTCDLPTQE